MLHGMIPAAFFATLLRRYLDSLVETPEYATSSATFTLGTSAAFATAGIAIYGFGLLSKNQKPDELIENNKELEVTETAQEDSHRKVKKRRSRNRIRRRQHKGKQWFLKNMKHYKSKYGRKIGKLMNHILGTPFIESPVESTDSDISDDEICTRTVQKNVFDDSNDIKDLKDTDEQNSTDKTIFDSFSSQISTLNEDDSVLASKSDFDDDDTEVAEVVRKRSSSLDLKDLLKENFERQKNRRSSRRSSSVSERSNKSSNSQKYASNRSPRNRSRSNNSKFSSKRSTHDRANKYSHQRKDSGERNYFPNRSSTKKTRSGRSYDQLIP